MEDYRRNAQFGLITGLIAIAGLAAMNEVDAENSDDALKDFAQAMENHINSHPEMADNLSYKVLALLDVFFETSILGDE